MYIKIFTKKKPSKEDLNNIKGKDYVVLLMPSQQFIVKSLIRILSGKLSNAGIKAERLLEVNRNKANILTRSQQQSIFDRSINRAEYYNEKLSIRRRHKGLIRKLLGEAENSKILHMTIREQKQKIEKFIRGKDMKQNRIRERM